MIIHERLKEVLSYDKGSGIFTWINVSKYHSEKNGTIAGCENEGYLLIKIDGVKYRAHRLAYLYVKGYLPDVVDHKDGIGLHNWWDNLRECTVQQNNMNHGKTINKSGLPCGVRFMRDKYQARLICDEKTHYLGVYETPEEAESVYLEKRKELFGEFNRDNP